MTANVVKVFHRDMFANEDAPLTHVANVDVSSVIADGVEAALEYAFRWTNNVAGSWSRKDDLFLSGECDGEERTFENEDLNDNVEVVAPLPVRNGMVLGIRSTSAFDVMELNGKRYTVDPVGFNLIEA